ncbi:unnamed protein product [Cyclocybe aegerita]|uniref:Fungal-type protein kinase domain-containing protein n=1 Tax=Cyclocybe aegerita TaxID=1973307 RepID=A0A8S0WZ11_CYCAE|nr:unnamed protein product [Cyclocybe aegerita]
MSIEYLKRATRNSHKSKLTQSESIDPLQVALPESESLRQTPPRTPEPKSIASGSSETPLRTSCHGRADGFSNIAAMTPMLEAEIKGSTQDVDDGFFNRVVKQRVRRTGFTDASITQFVRNCGLYNNNTKKWNNIRKPKLEKKLYEPFYKIFQKVIAAFKLEEREAINTFNVKIQHIEGDTGDTSLKTSPDLFIYGSGPNFHSENLKLKFEEKADYKYCASPCEVKTERNLKEKVLTQVGVYARQCFIQQGNRHYVHSLVMTEKRAFLLQFDRNGLLRSKYINIHENPKDFVYLILLVSSPNCTTLGFDTTVYWRGDKRYIETLNEKGQRVEYEILKSKPLFQRRTIRGRGTLCWLGRDPDGELRVIKDSWQAKGRGLESDLLQEVEGVQGIGQMVAFEPEKLTIAALRGMEGKELPTGMVDRLFRRIILRAYGQQIDKFTNRRQLLHAFRDAVAGHQRLWDRNIIHRDISVNNILIGEEGAEEGWRGLLIDMDMAVRWQRAATMAAVDFRTGTRAFQAILVISSEKDKADGKILLAHDYLDDLESFFYVFCWVCMRYTPTGERVKSPPLGDWETEDPSLLIPVKWTFINPPVAEHNELVNTFGQAFQDLFDGLRDFTREMHKWKLVNRATMPNKLENMKPHSDKNYAKFLELVDKAIVALEKEEQREQQPNLGPSSQQGPSPSLSEQPSIPAPPRSDSGSSQHIEPSSSMKRTRDQRDADENEMDVDDQDGPPAPKRTQTRSPTQSLSQIAPAASTDVVATEANPAAPSAKRRSLRLRAESVQSVQVNVEAAPAPMARRQSTRSRNGSRSTQPAEAPLINNGASSSNGTRPGSRNGSTGSRRQITRSGGSSGAGVGTQSAGVSGLRRGRSATRKNKN